VQPQPLTVNNSRVPDGRARKPAYRNAITRVVSHNASIKLARAAVREQQTHAQTREYAAAVFEDGSTGRLHRKSSLGVGVPAAARI
jgi:hypothetical protein